MARRADGRPATSSIAPPDLTDKPACVIGSNDASAEHVEQVIAGATATEVDRLSFDRRSLNLLARRDYGLLVFDAQPDDSIAMLNELGRRLSSVRRKGTLVLVCRDRERLGPALERLTTEADAITLERPIRALAVLEVAGLTRSVPDAVAV